MPVKVSEIILLLLLIRADHLYTADYILACSYKFSQDDVSIEAQFSVRDIDFSLCTHYIYWSAQVDTDQITIKAAVPSVEDGLAGTYKQFNDGKKRNSEAKTILSLGRQGDLQDAALRAINTKDNFFHIFAKHTVGFLRDKGFDGLNLFWLTRDEQSRTIVFPRLLQALRNAFDNDYIDSKLLLTITGFAFPLPENPLYDISGIKTRVDYVFMPMPQLVNSYIASFLDPLYSNHNNKAKAPSFSVNQSIYDFWKIGMPYSKMVMGVTALGHYVQLKDPTKSEPYSAIVPAVLRGPKYYIPRRLAYPEVCDMMNVSVKYFDNIQKNPYLVSGWLWVGYTDPQSLKEKIDYMKLKGLAGIEFSHVNEDDFSGKACKSGKFPLMSFIKTQMLQPPSSVATTPLMSTDSTTSTTSSPEGAATTTFQINTTSVEPVKSTFLFSHNEASEAHFGYLLHLIPPLIVLLTLLVCILFVWPFEKEETAAAEAY